MKKFLVPLLLVVSSCATHLQFEKNLHSYVGKPSSLIVSTFGPPKQLFKIDQENKVWAYGFTTRHFGGISQSQYYQPFGGTDYFNQTNGMSWMTMKEIKHSCKFWFVIGKNNVVNSVGDKGDRCLSKKENDHLLPPAPNKLGSLFFKPPLIN